MTDASGDGRLLALSKNLLALKKQIESLNVPSSGPSFDDIYPVGSIYMSVNSTDPGLLFGGTWTQIKDTFLLAAGDTYDAGDTGGEATHTLTTDEMPSHTHSIRRYNSSATITGGNHPYNTSTSSSNKYSMAETASDTGGGQAHNNMPPYLAVYCWQRTA